MSRIADRNISEALIWHIWREQLSKLKHLKLTDGRTVRIHHPGILNADSGPDFLGAELSYGPGGRLRGDVEIHLRPSDWYRHGHDQDPRYNRVVLHVVMWTDNSLTMVRKYNRQYIPTLILSRHLQESLPHLRNIYQNKQQIDNKKVYPCQSVIDTANQKDIQNILYTAGHTRFEKKSEDMVHRMGRVSSEQTLYEYTMRTAGYAKNTESFHELARRLPLKRIRSCVIHEKGIQRTMVIQALLLGTAGLLPSQRLAASSPIEAHPYIQEIETLWDAYGPELSIRTMDEKHWLFFRLRPFNFPTVRLAGMSYLISSGVDGGLDRAFKDILRFSHTAGHLLRQITKSVIQAVKPSREDYWLTHTVFGIESSTHRSSLIGVSRVREMIVNTILPFLFAQAKQSQDQNRMILLKKAYEQYPKLSDNQTIQNMTRLLFQKKLDHVHIFDKAILQQALIEIDQTTCHQKKCTWCILGKNQHRLFDKYNLVCIILQALEIQT